MRKLLPSDSLVRRWHPSPNRRTARAWEAIPRMLYSSRVYPVAGSSIETWPMPHDIQCGLRQDPAVAIRPGVLVESGCEVESMGHEAMGRCG